MGSPPNARRSTSLSPTIRAVLAIASIATGAIHAAVTPEHLAESAVLGAAFLMVAMFQVAWAVPAAGGATDGVLTFGAFVNGAVVVAWVVSRTVGLPVGPHAWVPEAAGFLDVTATALELVVVMIWALAERAVPVRSEV
jgi:hypothetical protein